jgi:hypothetical protein
MADPADYEIIAGIGNEVFYFFGELPCATTLPPPPPVVVLLTAVVAAAWYSTQVVEPVVQSVILVERTAVVGAAARPSSPEDVRAAVSQFLQQQPEEEEAEQEGGQQEEEESLERPPEVQEELPEEERVTIRLKFLNETQKDVEASLVESLGQFKRRNFTEEIGDNKNVRLIFNGQVLREEGNSLRSCGLFDKCVTKSFAMRQCKWSGPSGVWSTAWSPPCPPPPSPGRRRPTATHTRMRTTVSSSSRDTRSMSRPFSSPCWGWLWPCSGTSPSPTAPTLT